MDFPIADGSHRHHGHVERVPDGPPFDGDIAGSAAGQHNRQQHERRGHLRLHESARRYSLTLASGLPADSRSEITATDAAPARMTSGARSRVIPPIATIGVAQPAARRIPAASLTNAVPTSRYPVSFVEVPKIGPTAI